MSETSKELNELPISLSDFDLKGETCHNLLEGIKHLNDGEYFLSLYSIMLSSAEGNANALLVHSMMIFVLSTTRQKYIISYILAKQALSNGLDLAALLVDKLASEMTYEEIKQAREQIAFISTNDTSAQEPTKLPVAYPTTKTIH